MEPIVHGRGRKSSSLDEIYMGVHEELLYARKVEPVEGIFLPDSSTVLLSVLYRGFSCSLTAFLRFQV